MKRETAVAFLESLTAIENELDTCPHGVARRIEQHLRGMRDAIDEVFDGGYAGKCAYCERPIGHDENVRNGDEPLCKSCWKRQLEEMRTCRHDLKRDADEYGNAIWLCGKCGYVSPAAVGPHPVSDQGAT